MKFEWNFLKFAQFWPFLVLKIGTTPNRMFWAETKKSASALLFTFSSWARKHHVLEVWKRFVEKVLFLALFEISDGHIGFKGARCRAHGFKGPLKPLDATSEPENSLGVLLYSLEPYKRLSHTCEPARCLQLELLDVEHDKCFTCL